MTASSRYMSRVTSRGQSRVIGHCPMPTKRTADAHPDARSYKSLTGLVAHQRDEKMRTPRLCRILRHADVTRDVTVVDLDLDLDLENNNTPRDVNVVTRARSLVSTRMMLNEGGRR